MNSSRGSFTGHQRADLGLLLVLIVVIGAYLDHVLSLSTHTVNVIFVLPFSILALVLCAVELLSQIKNPGREEPSHEPVRSVLPVITLFSAYVLLLPWLGFDVGTALFISLFLLIHGEKRWHWGIAYGIVLGFLAAWTFSALLPYPMPMLLLATEY